MTLGYTVPVTDVTGAGDTLGGALDFSLRMGWERGRPDAFAVAAASRSVMHAGLNGGIATVSEVDEFIREYGVDRVATVEA